jgi:general secretion pathway protein H
MNASRTYRQADAGFTLVELLTGIAVLSLVVTIATPLLRGPPASARVAADAAHLAAAMRVTRAAAMAHNREMAVIVAPTKRAYASPVIPTQFLDPRMDLALTVGRKERSASEGRIRFFPNGRSTGGDVLLRLGSVQARVQVNWATGHVHVGP